VDTDRSAERSTYCRIGPIRITILRTARTAGLANFADCEEWAGLAGRGACLEHVLEGSRARLAAVEVVDQEIPGEVPGAAEGECAVGGVDVIHRGVAGVPINGHKQLLGVTLAVSHREPETA